MNKAFEKILDGIESLKSNKGFGGTIQTMYADGMLDKAKEIVQEVAEEYATDINVGTNGWIPCSERMPEPIRPVLVTLKNWMKDKCFVRVGRFHTDHWKIDEGIVENSIVLAWQPLPEPYKDCKETDLLQEGENK